jgi:hypothetical protein
MNEQKPEPTATQPRRGQYVVYKPNGRGSGGALRFSLNRERSALFVEGAAQAGERQFDWENKIIMKWGHADIGAVLAVLQGRLPQAKLFHQGEKASSAFEFTARDEPDRAPYLAILSRQDGATKTVQKVGIPVTHAEAAVLEAVLRAGVLRLLAL